MEIIHGFPCLSPSYNAEYRVKRANIFDEEDLVRYYTDILVKSDAYELVRGVVLVLGFFGGLRVKDVKELRYKGTKD